MRHARSGRAMAVHTRQWMAHHPERSNLKDGPYLLRERVKVERLASLIWPTVGPIWQGLIWRGMVPLLINLLILVPPAVGVVMTGRMMRGRGPLLVIFVFASCNRGRAFGNPARLAGQAATLTDLKLGIGWALIFCLVMINFGAAYAVGLVQIARWVKEGTRQMLHRRRYRALVRTRHLGSDK